MPGKINSLHNPLQLAARQAEVAFAVDKRLLAPEDVSSGVPIPRYHLRFAARRKDEHDSTNDVVVMEDWLAQEPIVFRHVIEPPTTTEQYDAQQNELADKIQAAMAAKRPEVNLESVKLEVPREVFGFASKPLSTETAAQLERFNREGRKILLSFGYKGEGALASFLRSVPIDSVLKYGKLKAEHVNEITLYRKQPPEQADTMSGLVKPPAYDTYGNLVIHEHIGTKSESDPQVDAVRYIPPYPFGKRGERFKDVNLDLGEFGTPGLLVGLLERPMLEPVPGDPQGTYVVYATEEIASGFKPEQLAPIASGARAAETLFGYKPGEAVKNIYVVADEALNAYYSKHDTVTVSFQRGIASSNVGPEGERIDAARIGRHEAYHLIDDKLDLSADELWQKLFQSLGPAVIGFFGYSKPPSEYYQRLNESGFDPQAPIMGGHSGDNPQEFLASFLNSLDRDRWEEALCSHPAEFAESYKQTLATLGDMLKKYPQLEGAPIIKLVRARLTKLLLEH